VQRGGEGGGGGRGGLRGEGPGEPIGQMLAAGEKSFKGDSASDRSVMEKQSDLSTRRQLLFVCLGRIDARAADVLPAPSSEGTDAAGLMRGKNGETNSQLGENLQALNIPGRFW